MHTGIDTSLFRPMPVKKNTRPTMVFVGRIEANKGVDLLVDAGCRLAQSFPELRLQLLGRGSEKTVRGLVERAAAAGHPNMIELPGYVERKQLPEYLSRADVFAAPSDYEGGPGFVLLEAMSCGLPVVACEGSGVSETIEHGVTGCLVPPRDVDALYDSLKSLLADQTLRLEMGQRAAQLRRAHGKHGRLPGSHRGLFLGSGTEMSAVARIRLMNPASAASLRVRIANSFDDPLVSPQRWNDLLARAC